MSPSGVSSTFKTVDTLWKDFVLISSWIQSLLLPHHVHVLCCHSIALIMFVCWIINTQTCNIKINWILCYTLDNTKNLHEFPVIQIIVTHEKFLAWLCTIWEPKSHQNVFSLGFRELPFPPRTERRSKTNHVLVSLFLFVYVFIYFYFHCCSLHCSLWMWNLSPSSGQFVYTVSNR